MQFITQLISQNFGLLILLGVSFVVGYNLYLWQRDKAHLANRKQAEPPPALENWPELPLVSVLVAAWNESEYINRHIESFLKLRYPNKEMILMAGGGDGTYEIAKAFVNHQVFIFKQFFGEGKQSALHRGLQSATGRVIYLTDADCLVDDESFEQVIMPIAINKEQAVSGRFAPLVEQRHHPFVQMQWCIDNYGRSRKGANIQGLIGRNAAIERSLLAETGDFLEPTEIGTDYLLAQQILLLGKKIAYRHQSMVETDFHTNFKYYINQQTRWLRNIFAHGKEFGSYHQVLDVIKQWILGVLFILFTLISFVFGGTPLIIWTCLFLHGWISRARYLHFGKLSLGLEINWCAYFLAPFYLMLDQWMLVHALISWMRKKERSNW